MFAEPYINQLFDPGSVEVPMALHERLRQRRRERGMTSAAIAREADISRGYLSEIENGHAPRPSGAVLMRIATALGTTIGDLLEDETEVPRVPIPTPLEQFAEQADLPEDDVQMLAQIKFRGAQPASVEDWRFLYESIKRSVPKEG